jgi:hypothetical protein
VAPPRATLPTGDEDGLPLEPEVWTEEEFRAIRAGRVKY